MPQLFFRRLQGFAGEDRLLGKLGQQRRGIGAEFIAALLRVVHEVGFGARQRHLHIRARLLAGIELDPRRVNLRPERIALRTHRPRFFFKPLQFCPRRLQLELQLLQADLAGSTLLPQALAFEPPALFLLREARDAVVVNPSPRRTCLAASASAARVRSSRFTHGRLGVGDIILRQLVEARAEFLASCVAC